MDGARLPDAPAPDTTTSAPAEATVEAEDLSVPPADLPEAQQAFWRRYAPYAIEQRTLVPSTVAGFLQLCAQAVMTETLAARIEHVGAASKRAEVPLRNYVKLSQRLDATLARFKLTSFGKPVAFFDLRGAPAAPVAANPWAKVVRK